MVTASPTKPSTPAKMDVSVCAVATTTHYLMHGGEMSHSGLSLLNGLDSVSISRIIIWIGNHWKRLMYSPIVEGLDTGAVGSG